MHLEELCKRHFIRRISDWNGLVELTATFRLESAAHTYVEDKAMSQASAGSESVGSVFIEGDVHGDIVMGDAVQRNKKIKASQYQHNPQNSPQNMPTEKPKTSLVLQILKWIKKLFGCG